MSNVYEFPKPVPPAEPIVVDEAVVEEFWKDYDAGRLT